MGRPLGGFRRRDAEQTHFRRRIETEAEQKTDGIHLPAMLDQSEQIPEDASEKSALAENQVEVFIHKLPAALDVLKGAINRNEDDDVGSGDGQQEKGGNGRADDSADGLKGIEMILNRDGSQGDDDRQTENDGRMAEEKKKPTPTGRLPCCISLRVTLSIAAMWSASTAWRRPNV